MHFVLSEALAAAVDSSAAPGAAAVCVEGEADLASVGSVRSALEKTFGFSLALGALLLLLGRLTFSRIATAVVAVSASASSLS